MIGALGAQFGLLAFAAAILAGLLAGNSAGTVLTRALLSLVAAALIGQAAGAALKVVLRDHLQSKKRLIDQEHVREMDAIRAAATQSDAAASKPQARA